MIFLSGIIRLSYKNLIECKKDLIIGIISAIFFNAAVIIGIAVLDTSEDFDRFLIQAGFTVGAVLTYLVVGEALSAVIGCDRTSRFYSFASTVPYGVSKLIVSKYLLVFLISAVETLLFSLLACVIGCGLNPAFPLALMIIQLFMRAVEIPLMLLFGVKSGKAVKGTVFGTAVMVFVIYMLYGDISWLSGDLIASAMRFAEDIMNNIGTRVMLIGVVGAIVIVLYMLSLWVSVTVAKRNFVKYETV